MSIRGFYICWAAQAALYHHYGIGKHKLPEKMFGVFRHRLIDSDAQLLRGFKDEFPVPVSRHTEVRAVDVLERPELKALAVSQEAGVCLVENRTSGTVYMFNHLEYDTGTLADEYLRDRQAGRPVKAPCNYFPDDDAKRPPENGWRSYGKLLFANWLTAVERSR